MSRIRLTRIASITTELDRIAGELESYQPEAALALDQVSDRLDGRRGADWAETVKENYKKAIAIENKVAGKFHDFKSTGNAGGLYINNKNDVVFVIDVDGEYHLDLGKAEADGEGIKYTPYKGLHKDIVDGVRWFFKTQPSYSNEYRPSFLREIRKIESAIEGCISELPYRSGIMLREDGKWVANVSTVFKGIGVGNSPKEAVNDYLSKVPSEIKSKLTDKGSPK